MTERNEYGLICLLTFKMFSKYFDISPNIKKTPANETDKNMFVDAQPSVV